MAISWIPMTRDDDGPVVITSNRDTNVVRRDDLEYYRGWLLMSVHNFDSQHGSTPVNDDL